MVKELFQCRMRLLLVSSITSDVMILLRNWVEMVNY